MKTTGRDSHGSRLGRVEVLDAPAAPEALAALAALAAKYAAYRSGLACGPVLRLAPDRAVWWRAAG
jgi:hypothetical protein